MLAGVGLLVLGSAVFVVQLANFYSMGLDLMDQTQWAICPSISPTGDGSCTPRDAVPSMWPIYVAPIVAGVGALLLLQRIVLDLRNRAREVSINGR